MARCAVVTLGLLLLFPAAAPAATARIDVREAGRDTTSTLRVIGLPGETNRLVATRADDGEWVVTDEGAPLTAGPGCRTDAQAAVRCPRSAGYESAEFDAGDGDDVVRVEAPLGSSIVVRGGAGDDLLVGDGIRVGIPTLDGGTGADVLVGGPGQDSLIGGPGEDVLRGAGGDDVLAGDGNANAADAPTDDVLDGGPGSDTASYAGRTVPVLGDLARGVAGSGPEADRLIAVESLRSGSGADRLRGDDGDNVLSGGDGNDLLEGRGGNDRLGVSGGRNRLFGGPGDDRLDGIERTDELRGGPGNDVLSSRFGSRLYGEAGDDQLMFTRTPTRLSCGPGVDLAAGTPLRGQLLDGCEFASFGPFGILALATAPVRRGERELTFDVRCRAQGASVTTGCNGRVEVRLARPRAGVTTLGAARFAVTTGRRATAVLRLTLRARRALRTARPDAQLKLRLTGAGTIAPGAPVFPAALEGTWRRSVRTVLPR